ncbi:MAG: cbb3-type cytochrome c oxidase subunit I [Magnetococcales bacterium]|nr:cbb3-type cytochrome c oxidase subunit I [Magnetococcales bacterium]
MSRDPVTLTLPGTTTRPQSNRLATGWLILALASLVGAGMVVILIILARTPFVHALIPWTGSFRTALVIHVDLSVLVWFLSFAGLLASVTLGERLARWGRIPLGMALLGTGILTFSPFLGEDAPFMNNYVPVLNNSAFFLGIGLFGGGFSLLALLALWETQPASQRGEAGLRFGLRTALWLFFVALAILIWSGFALRGRHPQDETYFELLFWGSGHLLQFTHVQLQMLGWLWLAALAGLPALLSKRMLLLLFALGALPALPGALIPLLHAVESGEYRLAFTDLMIYGGGVASVPLALLLAWSLWRPAEGGVTPRRANPSEEARTALRNSLLLFAVGGIIGAMVQGVNVTIPAHYHGSIGSVTLVYMGLTYHILPGLGFHPPASRWANRQLNLYALGSLLHVIGLAWSGGHNVPRKTAGAAQGLTTLADKIPMGIMGIGGMLAVTGGILFLVLAFRSLRQGRQKL